MSTVIVTGTGTDVGKTIAVAALAACASGSVAVVKPAQTGVRPGEPGDLAEITRLSGCTDTYEFARYPDALSPHHAALVSARPALELGEAVLRITDLGNRYDTVLVEGAGGLLVPYDTEDGWTLVDLAQELDAPLMVVTRSDLGTVNHTALTVRTIEESELELAGIIIGSWPGEAGLAERCSMFDLARMAGRRRLSGVLPAGLSTVGDFRSQARAALAPEYGGTFDWAAFAAAHRP